MDSTKSVQMRPTYCESKDLCSGGPRYANRVAILSKGRRPTALRSLTRNVELLSDIILIQISTFYVNAMKVFENTVKWKV